MSAVQNLYRRVRYGKPIVVVSGLPRSGTSMAMKMLEAGGLSIVTDGLRMADEDNPKGYYEDERVKRLHKDEDKAWLRGARGKVVKIISFLLKSLPLELNYTDTLSGARAQAVRMAEFLGRPLDVEKMASVVDTQLYRNRA